MLHKHYVPDERKRALPKTKASCVLAALAIYAACVGGYGNVAYAQAIRPTLRAAELKVEIEEDGSSRVEAVYHLAGLDTARSLPLRGLLVFGTTYEGLEANVDGEPVRVEWASTRAPLVEGSLPIPASNRGQDAVRVRLHYVVPPRDAGPSEGFDVAVPLIFVNHAPAGAEDSTFSAVIHMPASYRVGERFPVVPADVSTQGSEKHYAFALQVLPSYIRLRGTTGGDEPRLTFSRKVDMGIMGSLVLIVLLFWHRFRSARSDDQRARTA